MGDYFDDGESRRYGGHDHTSHTGRTLAELYPHSEPAKYYDYGMRGGSSIFGAPQYTKCDGEHASCERCTLHDVCNHIHHDGGVHCRAFCLSGCASCRSGKCMFAGNNREYYNSVVANALR